MTFKKLYPNMSMDLKAFLGRELTYLELQVETELISLDPDETHDKIAFFPNVSIGDCSNLIVNFGVEEIYVKQTVMNLFFKLLERKSIHSPDQPFVYFVNNGNLSIAMESLFSKKKYGIFDYDKFTYTALKDGKWISVCVSQTERLHYDIQCYLPSTDWKKHYVSSAKIVEDSIKANILSVKKLYEHYPMEDLVINTTYIENSSISEECDFKDSGIYAMFYAYQFLLGLTISVQPKDISKLRSMVFFMMVTMDYRYGLVNIKEEEDNVIDTLK
jgi:hypothetical protein